MDSGQVFREDPPLSHDWHSPLGGDPYTSHIDSQLPSQHDIVGYSPYSSRAKLTIKEYHRKMDNILRRIPHLPAHPLPGSEKDVCIIGAGVAGLYAAMMLESLDIPYQVLEASDRVGGRLFTYKFKGGMEYDYYDVGAVRFPRTNFMKRTFDLIENRSLGVKKIEYLFNSPNEKTFYPYNAEGYVPQEYYEQGTKTIMKNVLRPFRLPFAYVSIDDAVSNLMKFDHLTTRSLMLQQSYPSSVINWCETMDKSTGWYDRALTETVLESVAFDWPTSKEFDGSASEDDSTSQDASDIQWYTIDKGCEELPKAMEKNLEAPIIFRTKVIAIADSESDDPGKNNITVTTQRTFNDDNSLKSAEDKAYKAVISTVPLPRLSLVDLSGCNLTYAQWSAIRELRYGPAIKVGIKFQKAWWETLPKPIIGGQSFTDLPIRTIVYPSYPAETLSKSRVLIASYCWTQDAERLGALINEDGTVKAELLKLIMKDLALVHRMSQKDIEDLYEDCFAWDWLHDPLTMGAFAFFGPQEFTDKIYTAVTTPLAHGKLFLAGEATSSCHAWVAGALDSSWRAVNQLLKLHYPPDKLAKFYALWGPSEYWDEDMLEKQIRLGLHFSSVA